LNNLSLSLKAIKAHLKGIDQASSCPYFVQMRGEAERSMCQADDRRLKMARTSFATRTYPPLHPSTLVPFLLALECDPDIGAMGSLTDIAVVLDSCNDPACSFEAFFFLAYPACNIVKEIGICVNSLVNK
jgi:hypothetical protein